MQENALYTDHQKYCSLEKEISERGENNLEQQYKTMTGTGCTNLCYSSPGHILLLDLGFPNCPSF